MQVIRGLENYTAPTDRRVVVTIGTFDGVHLGHQEILKRLTAVAEV
ncbi:MAG: adenylyltransferase/cytidyltransferase family protein, partial [candidate division Zixibacteria bacterium]|nr:adenylyltransferase/cytidyltransferase family protein [candidate division Zixibacteria bacterium]